MCYKSQAHLPYVPKKSNMCYKVFAKCVLCFGELEEISSSSSSSIQLAPFTLAASTNTKKAKRDCMESLWS